MNPAKQGEPMRTVVLTDGGTGQELVRRSARKPTPLWSATVLLEEPELVRDLHLEYLRAGAQVITVNTYSATPERLERAGRPELFEPLQARGVELAHRARDLAGPAAAAARIAGCLPPLFGSYAPASSISYEDTLAIYRRIVAAQADAVDLFCCETMASAQEARAAATAAAESGRPVWVSWTLSDDHVALLRSGESIAQADAALSSIPVAVRLLNCSRPETIDAALPRLLDLGGPVGAYGNGFTSVDALAHGGTVDVLHARADLGPQAYATHAVGWADAGASVVGGCCEVGPAHIAAVRAGLLERGYTIVPDVCG